MKLRLGKFRLKFGIGAKAAAASPIQAWLRGEDLDSSRGTAVLASPYQQSVWVYTVVSALAQTVSTIPFRISKGDRSGENILTSGPAVQLLNRPPPHPNPFRFFEFLVTSYLLPAEVFIVPPPQSDNV